MEFTGRITADAAINAVGNGKEVVKFCVAINDRYKPKGTNEVKEHVTFINVSWWMGTGIAKILRKAAIVTVTGRLSVNAYKDRNGEAKASLNCHAGEIKLVQSKKSETPVAAEPAAITEPVADLPF